MTQKKKRCTAIVLAAGSGKRMESKVPKQFLPVAGKPLIWYALDAVERSSIIDDCVLVTGERDVTYMKEEIVEKYGFSKVDQVIVGGAERYASVAKALAFIEEGGLKIPNVDGYVFIHDGARPFLTEQILEDTYQAVLECHACVSATPSKDTVKIADESGFAKETPNRTRVWNVQTPQVFDVGLACECYRKLMAGLEGLRHDGVTVTDDAMVVETFSDVKVKLVEGSYRNLKVTTPEDICIAEALMSRTNS